MFSASDMLEVNHQKTATAEHIGFDCSLLVSLADDVLSIIGTSLSIGDICNLSMCCKTLNVAVSFDKIWLAKCEELGVLTSTDLVDWRKAVISYKALCRFLTSVKPLLGFWVNNNWDVGNVVYVMPGFASVVGCRGIPQSSGPSGIEGRSIMWAPVFEVISDDNGALAFVLHGRDRGEHYIYPGTMKSIDKTCNVLLLEVESKEKHCADSKSLHRHSKEETRKKMSKLYRRISKWLRFADKNSVTMPLSNLSFQDKWKLLEIVSRSVGIQVPYSTCDSLLPCSRGDENRFKKDVAHSSEHREVVINMRELGAGYSDRTANHENDSRLPDFLKLGDTVGLTLQASTMRLEYGLSPWPYTNGRLFALYKLRIQEPTVGQEYAGSWGVNFGWPPRKPTENDALFFVVLSYCEVPSGDRLLRATKTLEGTELVPCSSSIFIVNVDKPSTESFPWISGTGSLPVSVTQAFTGYGDGNGDSFGRAGSTPGSLFVLEDGVLAFVWTATGSVVTLQRVNLDEILRKCQRVPPLPPVNNFSYTYGMNRRYPTVFTDV